MKKHWKYIRQALIFLLGLLIMPHIYAAYFISTIDYGTTVKPIEEFIDAGNKLYVVAYLMYAFLPKLIREIKFFNFLYFCVIYALLMYVYLSLIF